MQATPTQSHCSKTPVTPRFWPFLVHPDSGSLFCKKFCISLAVHSGVKGCDMHNEALSAQSEHRSSMKGMQGQWAKHKRAGGGLPLQRVPPSSHCQEHSAGSRPGLGPASLAEMCHQIHRVRAPGHDDPQMALRRCASESHSFCEGVKSRLLTYASSGAFFPFLGTRCLHVPAMFTSQSSAAHTQIYSGLSAAVLCTLGQACLFSCMHAQHKDCLMPTLSPWLDASLQACCSLS